MSAVDRLIAHIKAVIVAVTVEVLQDTASIRAREHVGQAGLQGGSHGTPLTYILVLTHLAVRHAIADLVVWYARVEVELTVRLTEEHVGRTLTHGTVDSVLFV